MKNNFNFTQQKELYKGKVRDVYSIGDDHLVMIVSDRISAFDVILPKPIPHKGQILNQIASKFLKATSDIVPNWLIDTPDPVVSVGKRATPFKVEMVIRGYLSGYSARLYNSGVRTLCGIKLPEDMKENQKFPHPIITPTTKASVGHDEDISREDIISSGIVSESDYIILEKYTHDLFQRGTEMAKERGLILVDTKYEFGKDMNGNIILMDEIHTPDSSRYFYIDGYEERLKNNEPQRQLSKEFVRQWLINNGFQGKDGQTVPEMTDEYCLEVSKRYIELYELITGEKFIPITNEDIDDRIYNNVNNWISNNII